MCDSRWFFLRVSPSFVPIRPGFLRSRLFWRITELCSLARCSESTPGVPRGAQSRAVIYAVEHVPCLRHQMIAGRAGHSPARPPAQAPHPGTPSETSLPQRRCDLVYRFLTATVKSVTSRCLGAAYYLMVEFRFVQWQVDWLGGEGHEQRTMAKVFWCFSGLTDGGARHVRR